MAQETRPEKPQDKSKDTTDLNSLKSEFDRNYKIWSKTKSEEFMKRPVSADGKSLVHHRREVSKSDPPSHRVYGFENEVSALKNFLLKKSGEEEDEFKTLAVVGKLGVGKTALCQMVFNDEEVAKRFVPRIWMSMYGGEEIGEEGGNPKKELVKRILRNLGVGNEMLGFIKQSAETEHLSETETVGEKELSRLLYALQLNLWGKKFLIVLDDACESDGWDERLDEEQRPEGKKWGTRVSCGFPKASGGRVIFTSRSEKLAGKLVGKDNLFRLYPISDPESCWSIYRDAVRENLKRETDLQMKKRNEDLMKMVERNFRVLRKCKEDLMAKTGGVPLAARLMMKLVPQEIEPLLELMMPNRNDTDQTDMNLTDTDLKNTDQTDMNLTNTDSKKTDNTNLSWNNTEDESESTDSDDDKDSDQ